VRGVSGTLDSRIQWNDRQMSLVMRGDANQPSRMVTSSVRFTSPFSGFESLSANFQYRVNGATRRTNAGFSWARDKQVCSLLPAGQNASRLLFYSLVETLVFTPR